MKLSQLGEFGLIELLSKEIGKPAKEVLVGIGDDTAVIQFPARPERIRGVPSSFGPSRSAESSRRSLRTRSQFPVKYQLVTTDTLIENIHFKLKTTSFFDLGCKALAINISDIAAMGGVPTYALVTIGANRNFSVKKIEDLYRGIKRLAAKHKIQIIGGDTVSSPKEMIISITLLGEVEKDYLLTRSGAKVGDAILVTGDFGGPASKNYTSQFPVPSPRLKETRTIAKSAKCSSMIDSSDGLVRSVLEVTKASKVGARIWLDSVPIANKANLEQALYGGEEYELIFTVPRKKAVELKKLVEKKTKTKVSIIGEIVAKKHGIKLVDLHGKTSLLKKKGYEHFK